MKHTLDDRNMLFKMNKRQIKRKKKNIHRKAQHLANRLQEVVISLFMLFFYLLYVETDKTYTMFMLWNEFNIGFQ